MGKQKKVKNEAVKSNGRKATIAVIIVISIAAFFLVAIAVLCLVKSDPVKKLEKPERYVFYNLGSNEQAWTSPDVQSRIRVAMDDMDFNIMSGILQWSWDYSFNFKRNDGGEKIEMSAEGIANLSATSSEYMIEWVYKPTERNADGTFDYSTAQSIKVDGETVYFDRIKMFVGKSDSAVGILSFYPYIDARINNESDVEGVASDTYRVVGVNVRANINSAFANLEKLAKDMNLGTVTTETTES